MPQGLPGCTPGLIPNLALTRGACRHQPRTGLFPPDCCGVAGCGERGEGNPGTADAETYRRERGKGTGAADRVRPIRRPQYRSDADELLEAVVAAGFGRVEGAVGVHPRTMDAAGDELTRRFTLLPPAADLGPVALPDLDAGATRDVEGTVSVEGDPVGVADALLQADEHAVSGEDLPAVVLAVHHIDEIVCGDQQLVRHVELARVGARPAGHGAEIEPLWNENRIAAA